MDQYKLAPYVGEIRDRIRTGDHAPDVQRWLEETHGVQVHIRCVRSAARGDTYADHPSEPVRPLPRRWSEGESSPHARLTADQARSIDAQRPDNWVVGGDNRRPRVDRPGWEPTGQSALAEEFGVTRRVIRLIWNEEAWTSVTLNESP